MSKSSNTTMENGVITNTDAPIEHHTSPENQLANLRDILFGTTAKSIEERLEQLEATLQTQQATQIEWKQSLNAERQTLESQLQSQIQTLQAENAQLKNELSQIEAQSSQKVEQLEQALLVKIDEQATLTQAVDQKMVQNQHQLGNLLIQLGSQLQHGLNE
ncbi:MAG: hypothetical protein AAF490_10460 [Chloroflexota bacterium]